MNSREILLAWFLVYIAGILYLLDDAIHVAENEFPLYSKFHTATILVYQ